MPISYIGLFMAIMLINHVALTRVAAADELFGKTLTNPPLYSGLLTGFTLVVSITLLEYLSSYTQLFPVLRVLNQFMYLLVMAFIAHLLCVFCFKLKPNRLVPALFPIAYINSVGLGVLVPKLNIGLAPSLTALLLAIFFMFVSSIFYYGNLCFNTTASSQKLSITLLMTGIFALLFFGLIAFH